MSHLIGKTVGQYQIVEQIGVGGMATVFKAYQLSIDRYVAIKVLPSQFAQDPNFVKRFAQEAKAIAALEHPHILPVHDFGTEEGLNYMVMRYVEGGTLNDLMGQPIPHKQIVGYVGNVARALDYAHKQGVVHRDIKPSNILIDQHGEVLLTDFGIAKIMEGSKSTQLTADGNILGTPAYMSPEQAQASGVDGRSDIYSLGVVLYELLTGRPPYQAETPFAVALKHITEPLPPPRSVDPDIPEAFERVVLKAMAKDPNQRFETAGQMEQALQNALVTSGARTTPASPVVAAAPAAEDGNAATSATLRPPTMNHKKPQPVKKNEERSSTNLMLIGGAIAVVLLCLMAGAAFAVFGLANSSEEPVAVNPTASATEQQPAQGEEASNPESDQQPSEIEQQPVEAPLQEQPTPTEQPPEPTPTPEPSPTAEPPPGQQPPPLGDRPPPPGQAPPLPPGQRPPPPPDQQSLPGPEQGQEDNSSGEARNVVLFQDDFNSDEDDHPFIDEYEDEYGYYSADLVDGHLQLFLTNDSEDGNYGWTEVPYLEARDFVVSVQMIEAEADVPFIYGIAFRSNPEGEYTFEIEDNGFSVFVETVDDYKALIEFTETSAINPYGPNQLIVEAIGPMMRFFINGEEVANVQDDSHQEGSISLMVGLFEEEGEVTVDFDNLVVATP